MIPADVDSARFQSEDVCLNRELELFWKLVETNTSSRDEFRKAPVGSCAVDDKRSSVQDKFCHG